MNEGYSVIGFQELKNKLKEKISNLEEVNSLGSPSVIGCLKWALGEKIYFLVSDLGSKVIEVNVIDEHLRQCYQRGIESNTKWSRILGPNFVTLSILYSDNISQDAREYCSKLKPHINSIATFQIPVLVDRMTGEFIIFRNRPIVGILIQPFLKRLIANLISNHEEAKAA